MNIYKYDVRVGIYVYKYICIWYVCIYMCMCVYIYIYIYIIYSYSYVCVYIADGWNTNQYWLNKNTSVSHCISSFQGADTNSFIRCSFISSTAFRFDYTHQFFYSHAGMVQQLENTISNSLLQMFPCWRFCRLCIHAAV